MMIQTISIIITLLLLPNIYNLTIDSSTQTSKQTQFPIIINIPLDQRFTTRIAFLNLIKLTPFPVISLPYKYLPSLKHYNKPQQIHTWLNSTTQHNKQHNLTYIISLQTIIYGSLIASRISNDSYEIIMDRLSELLKIKEQSKLGISIYMSTVVMRIPNYNFSFEEPEYWAQYGQLLYTYSYYSHKYSKLHNQSDLIIANNAKNKIPIQILQQFTWRRQRNQQILMKLLQMIRDNPKLITRLYITLDDNAEYGFNIAEAEQLRKLIVRIYPGADQVSLILLARFSCDYTGIVPIAAMYYRNITTKINIPNYQGLPLQQTIQHNIHNSGAYPINGTLLKRGNITLLINNFNSNKQIQAPNQYLKQNQQKQPSNYNQTLFSPLCYPGQSNQIYGFIDNRYSNGVDCQFMEWIIQSVNYCRKDMERWCYAGWNTNGNTVGTVVANTVILYVMRSIMVKREIEITDNYLMIGDNYISHQLYISDDDDCPYCSPCPKNDITCSNIYFNLLRILQDRDWQAILRQKLIDYILEVPGDSTNHLETDLAFYIQYSEKSMSRKLTYLQNQLTTVMKKGLKFELEGLYYPWNRTFQIGLYAKIKSNNQLWQMKQL